MPCRWSAIGVPIDSVGRAGGTELAPAALRECGLLERVGADDAGDLDVRIRGNERDPGTGVIGSEDVLEMTAAVRAAVRDAASAGARPLVLGGCCSLVPGALAGMRDAGLPAGVAYVDGHVDVYDGETSPTGEAADMPMAVAFGLGPAAWVEASGGRAASPGETVVLGARDEQEAADVARLLADDLRELAVLGPGDLRGAGVRESGARAAGRLTSVAGRFWIHLDVDVLDERAMPATDYLMPGGLEWDELAELMEPLGDSEALAGLSLGCLNPEKDSDGAYVQRTCALLAEAIGR